MTMPALIPDDPPSFAHVTVMRDEVVQAFDGASGVVVDATAGGGGHSHALLARHPELQIVAFDRDRSAVEATRRRLVEFGARARVEQASFEEIGGWLDAAGVSSLSGVVADLGVSSQQLGEAERGMSFRSEGPLDMRMDLGAGETVQELVERLSQDELANVIYELGEERGSRRIARCIKQALEHGELSTTLDLRRAIVRALGPRRIGGVDPATRTFQALRMAVNGELEQLGALLELARERLCEEGVIAVISFHSLEDRMVKRELKERELWQRASSKPMLPSSEETAHNPRSRSAKLRVARRRAALSDAIPESEDG